jgi:hypothetical protein
LTARRVEAIPEGLARRFVEEALALVKPDRLDRDAGTRGDLADLAASDPGLGLQPRAVPLVHGFGHP